MLVLSPGSGDVLPSLLGIVAVSFVIGFKEQSTRAPVKKSSGGLKLSRRGLGTGDNMQIMRVYHGARRWPKGFERPTHIAYHLRIILNSK